MVLLVKCHSLKKNNSERIYQYIRHIINRKLKKHNTMAGGHFKIVAILKKRGSSIILEYSYVPYQWEKDGILYWPKRNILSLRKDPTSTYESDWEQYKCKVKKDNIVGIDEAELWEEEYTEPKLSRICKTCGKGFTTKWNLRQHEYTHTGEKLYKCKLCEDKFRLKQHLGKHVIAKHCNDERYKSNKHLYAGGVSYKCKTCNKEFKYESALYRHERTHNGEKPFECEYCGIRFSQKTTLEQHVVAHHFNEERYKSNKHIYTGGVSFKCRTCNKEFKYISALRRHEIIHNGEKPFECEYCGIRISQKNNLRRHIVRKHFNEERYKSNEHLNAPDEVSYKCKTCNKEFNNNSALCRHEIIHNGEKPFECGHCGIRFSQKCNLQRHVVAKHCNEKRHKSNKHLHTGGVSYKCGTCNKEFKNKSALSRRERIHNGEKPFECEHCRIRFSQKGNLRRHIVTKHFNEERYKFNNKHLYTDGVSYKCGTCNKKFKNKSALLDHERIHNGEILYHCEICKKMFSTKENLRAHVVAKHNNDERYKINKDLYTGGVSYKCGTCNKECRSKWQLSVHETSHKDEQRYYCEICGEMFRYISSLKRHKKLIHSNNFNVITRARYYTFKRKHV
ncbi:PREDICTED: zinc finger protein 91 [Cyphomyrmex costatus]|uniref:zinc finger protein 91 n=1 Tax=Cyphomyrmex costatus TaxID=456900 RepID=UPI00085243C4|nr:PREDICTED: zinc finger protein 91 [Cyphomyrmex costatus]